jgi:predicted AAA+ superfamily ATPase
LCYKNGEITYFQVTQNLIDESESNSNWDREVKNLEKIKDSNKKIILTLNLSNTVLDSGIKIINLYDWLLNEKYSHHKFPPHEI